MLSWRFNKLQVKWNKSLGLLFVLCCRHQQNRQLQKLYTCIIEKFLGIIDKWEPNLNNLEINSNSDVSCIDVFALSMCIDNENKEVITVSNVYTLINPRNYPN